MERQEEKVSDIDLALINLQKIIEETKDVSIRSMKIISHFDARALMGLIVRMKSEYQNVVDINQQLVVGIKNTITLTESGAKREDVVKSLTDTIA